MPLPWNKGKDSKITINCKECGKPFKAWPYRAKKRKYCSPECYHKSRTGKKRPEHSKWMKENLKKIHTPGAHKKLSESLKGRILSERTKKKMSESHKGIKPWNKGKKHPYSKETIEKMSKSARKRALRQWMDPEYAKKQRAKIVRGLMNKPTKPEQKIISIIKKYNLPFKYVGEGNKVIQGLNPDFIDIDGSKRIIEVFGDYWHKEKISSWKRTKFGRKHIFKQCGFDTLVLWGHEIHNLSDKEIADKIRIFGTG